MASVFSRVRPWSILKLLASIMLELVSCAQERKPIPPDRREAMRAFERTLKSECDMQGKRGNDAIVEQAIDLPDPDPACSERAK